MKSVSAYGAMIVLMNANPDFTVGRPVPYGEAGEFARLLSEAPDGRWMRHQPSGLAFKIDG